MKQSVSLRGSLHGSPRAGAQQRLTSIEAQHRALEERLRELGRRPYLTPKEQVELAEIKKHKLRAKDDMMAIRQTR